MTLAEEREARSGRTPPDDPADAFNGTAAATPNEVVAQQAQFRADDALTSQQEKFKASVQRTNEMLEKLKEMNDKSAQQRIEGIQKSLGVAGQVVAGLATSAKAQQSLKPIAAILGAMQNISGMLVNSYMQGTSEKDMATKINQGLVDTRSEMNKLGHALKQEGIDPYSLMPSKQIAEAGYTPEERTPTAGAPTPSA